MDLFTYGTLQFEEVWQRVVGRDFETVPGAVEGFAAYRVDGYDFPGMTPHATAKASGTVYLNLGPDTLQTLDHFEGNFYQRQTISVECADGVERPCEAYVFLPDNAASLTEEHWTPETFVSRGGLQRFLSKYVGFDRSPD